MSTNKFYALAQVDEQNKKREGNVFENNGGTVCIKEENMNKDTSNNKPQYIINTNEQKIS